jgi:chromosome segregation ATPase
MESIRQEIINMKKEKDISSERCAELSQLHTTAVQQCNSIQAELDDAENKIKRMEIDIQIDASTTAADANAVKELKDEVENLIITLRNKENETTTASKQCQAAEEKSERFRQSIAALEKKVTQCKENTETKRMQLERMTEKFECAERDLEDTLNTCKEMKSERSQHENRLLQHRKDKDVMEEKIIEMEEKISKLHRINEEMQLVENEAGKVSEMEHTVISMKKEMAEKDRTVSALESMVARKTESIDKLEQKLLSATEKNDVFAENIKAATKGVAERDQKIEELQKECDEMFEEIESKENKNDELKKSIDEHATSQKKQEKELNVLRKAASSNSTVSSASKEQIASLSKNLLSAEERIVHLEAHKLTDAHIQKFTNISETNKKLKLSNDKLKNKCIELLKTLEELGKTTSEGDQSEKMSLRDQKKYQKIKAHSKELKSKLQEYYTKVKSCKKDEKNIVAMIKKVPDINENTKNSTPCIGYVEKLIEFHMELHEISAEESKTIEMMEKRVNALQETRNEDLRLMEQGCSANERKYAALQQENDEITNQLNDMVEECSTVKNKLASTESTFKKAQKSDGQRIRFLEKENLDLMLQTNKLEKAAKMSKKSRSKKKSVEDKENATVVVAKEGRSKASQKKQSTESEDTMFLNELMADAGITEMEMNSDDGEEPECQTQ